MDGRTRSKKFLVLVVFVVVSLNNLFRGRDMRGVDRNQGKLGKKGHSPH